MREFEDPLRDFNIRERGKRESPGEASINEIIKGNLVDQRYGSFQVGGLLKDPVQGLETDPPLPNSRCNQRPRTSPRS